jgi:hypothetical protein
MMIRIPMHRRRHPVLILLFLAIQAIAQTSAPKITTPQQEFGFQIGDDYQLANYVQLTAYWQKLARESDRMKLVDIGKTAEGRTQWMAIISSPQNLAKLDHYRQISRRLALAEGISSDEEAAALAAEGKAVVWIDGGLHATEILGPAQLMELVYQMVSRNDRETLRILDDVILLAPHANPDGMDLVSNWYMRERDPRERSLAGVPRLYQKYIGHDNNRDSFMSTQVETTNMGRILYKEWIPQIMFNHHQTGPQGTVLFAPPFREPYSYRFDSMILTGIDRVGAAMHDRFAVENKPGATTRKGAPYSNWFNGGLRSTACYHNIIALLTETIGSPTPISIPFLPQRQLMNYDNPNPITPQSKWHFRQSVDYSITANRAVLDYASRNREHLLYGIYRMGRNSIDKGSRDSWTILPRHIEKAKSFGDLRRASERDPRGYILPSTQRDFATAVAFAQALQKTGITVHRATAAFTVNAKEYPAGSLVVKTAQAFRPHILDMFEPQNYPNDFQYPGGPPIAPYDNAGWTAAFQMGIEFDRILDGFEAPLEAAPDPLPIAPGSVPASTSGWFLDFSTNAAYRALNRLSAVAQHTTDHRVYFPATAKSQVDRAARETGASFVAAPSLPAGTRPYRKPRIGLVDLYGGLMPSGWMRWLFEDFGFGFEVVYPQRLDSGNLNEAFDTIILPQNSYGTAAGGRGAGSQQPKPEAIPEEFRAWLGTITNTKTIPRLKEFVEQGGSLIAIGTASRIGFAFGLPVADHLVEQEKPLGRDKFYIPGSILRARVHTASATALGVTPEVDLYFDNSPVYRLTPEAAASGSVTPLVWFSNASPLRSGWGWGQHHLNDGVIAAEASIGKGKLYLYGAEFTFRAQPHGTFKLVFNALHGSRLR